MIVANEKEIALLRECGKRLAHTMEMVVNAVAPGISTDILEQLVRKEIESLGDTPAFLGYRPAGAARAYPAASCMSINEEVVHGIPNENPQILQDGDIMTIDIAINHHGYITDMAHTVMVGTVDPQTKRLVEVAHKAREVAIGVANVGATTGDIGHAVQSYVESQGFSVPHDFGGHGVGKHVHEDPFIPNAARPGTGTQLVEGMVLAIEPIVMAGGGESILLPDDYTYVSKNGKKSAQFEHTVLLHAEKSEILTLYNF